MDEKGIDRFCEDDSGRRNIRNDMAYLGVGSQISYQLARIMRQM